MDLKDHVCVLLFKLTMFCPYAELCLREVASSIEHKLSRECLLKITYLKFIPTFVLADMFRGISDSYKYEARTRMLML